MDERGALEELFTATLDAFVGTRARLAAALIAAGQKAQGQALKKVRRPSPSAWATNQVVRRARAEVDAFLEASARLRASQGAIVAGRGERAAYQADAEDLRRATAALTAAARRILEDLGRADDRPIIERVVANARAAALTEAGRAALLAGALVADLDGEVDAFGGLLDVGARRAAGRRRPHRRAGPRRPRAPRQARARVKTRRDGARRSGAARSRPLAARRPRHARRSSPPRRPSRVLERASARRDGTPTRPSRRSATPTARGTTRRWPSGTRSAPSPPAETRASRATRRREAAGT